jgi:hypothetical protein
MACYFQFLARSGGTGRRAGLKIQWPQGRVGSTPSSGTIFTCINTGDLATNNMVYRQRITRIKQPTPS